MRRCLDYQQEHCQGGTARPHAGVPVAPRSRHPLYVLAHIYVCWRTLVKYAKLDLLTCRVGIEAVSVQICSVGSLLDVMFARSEVVQTRYSGGHWLYVSARWLYRLRFVPFCFRL